MIKQVNKKRKGFTLVELIVVIAILLILAVAAVGAYSGFELQARKASLKSDASAVVTALNDLNSFALTKITGANIIGSGSTANQFTKAWASTAAANNYALFMQIPGSNSISNAAVDAGVQMSTMNANHIQNMGSAASGNLIYYTSASSGSYGIIHFWAVNDAYIEPLAANSFSNVWSAAGK